MIIENIHSKFYNAYNNNFNKNNLENNYNKLFLYKHKSSLKRQYGIKLKIFIHLQKWFEKVIFTKYFWTRYRTDLSISVLGYGWKINVIKWAIRLNNNVKYNKCDCNKI